MAPKQTRIPGTERPRFPKIDAAAETYREARDEAARAKDHETVAKDALIAAMREAGVREYVDEDAVPPLRVTVADGPPKVKVQEVRRREEEYDDGSVTTITLTPGSAKAITEKLADLKRSRKDRAVLEAQADALLANAGSGELNDPSTKGGAARHRKTKTRSAKEVGAT